MANVSGAALPGVSWDPAKTPSGALVRRSPPFNDVPVAATDLSGNARLWPSPIFNFENGCVEELSFARRRVCGMTISGAVGLGPGTDAVHVGVHDHLHLGLLVVIRPIDSKGRTATTLEFSHAMADALPEHARLRRQLRLHEGL
jgi:hypothetical protein